MTAFCTVVGLAIGSDALSALITGGLIGGFAAKSISAGAKKAKANE
jgi:hypothetical protein